MGQPGGMSDPKEDPTSVWDLDQLISNKVRIKQVIEERTILRATQKHWVVELAAADTPIPPGKTEALSRTLSSLNLHLLENILTKPAGKPREISGTFPLPLPFQADNRSVLSCFAQHLVPLLVIPPDNVPKGKGQGEVKSNC